MENNKEIKLNPNTIKNFLRSRNFRKAFIAVSIGAAGGFLYYFYVGCASGSCAITSSPYMSVIMGGLLGYFVISSPCVRGKC
jgi:hypothetical protein